MPSVSSLEDASAALAAANADGRRLRIGDDLTTEGLDRILEHVRQPAGCEANAASRRVLAHSRLDEDGLVIAYRDRGSERREQRVRCRDLILHRPRRALEQDRKAAGVQEIQRARLEL